MGQSSGGSGQSWFLYDGHGSTRALADSAGSLTDRYSYDAYGVALGSSLSALNTPATALLYSGEQFDAQLAMGYKRARCYDMATGMWNRLDPYVGNHSDPQSLHKYAYCHGDPVNGVDPSGESKLLTTLAVQGIIGFLAGMLAGIVSSGKRKGGDRVAYVLLCAAAGALAYMGAAYVVPIIAAKVTGVTAAALGFLAVFAIFVALNLSFFLLQNRRMPNAGEWDNIRNTALVAAIPAGFGATSMVLLESVMGANICTFVGFVFDVMFFPLVTRPEPISRYEREIKPYE